MVPGPLRPWPPLPSIKWSPFVFCAYFYWNAKWRSGPPDHFWRPLRPLSGPGPLFKNFFVYFCTLPSVVSFLVTIFNCGIGKRLKTTFLKCYWRGINFYHLLNIKLKLDYWVEILYWRKLVNIVRDRLLLPQVLFCGPRKRGGGRWGHWKWGFWKPEENGVGGGVYKHKTWGIYSKLEVILRL